MTHAISVSTVSASTVAYDGHDLSTALHALRGMGFSVVELAYIKGYSETFRETVFDAAQARRCRTLLDATGLTCRSVSAHMDLSQPNAVDAMARRFAFARTVGAALVATTSAPTARRAEFMANIEPIIALAADAGVILALENPGDGMPSLTDDGPAAAALVKEIDSPWVRVNYDFGNLMSHHQGRVRPETDFLGAGDVTVHMHVKDVHRTEAGWEHTAIGAGDIDYAAILAALGRRAPMPWLSIEIPTRMTRTLDGRPRAPIPPLAPDRIAEMIVASLGYLTAHLAA